MLIRKKYIKEIRPFYDSDLIKTITGVRRCGKSVVLEQIKDELLQKTDNVVYLDFDDRVVTKQIQKWEDIVEYVDKNRKKDFCYVLLDEVQEIDDWQYACRSLRRQDCSVFITGSNSKLLSSEFTDKLSGRYVSFRIRPFVYNELQEYAKQLNKVVSIVDYLTWGAFPKRIEFDNEKDLRRYLNDLDETIIINDIVKRYKIKKVSEFRKVVDFILLNNARKYSANSIHNAMKASGVKCSTNTVQKWIAYLEEAFVVDEVNKYSKKAKRKLEQASKIYNCDVALNSIRVSDGQYDLTHNLENIVYNELLFRDYELSVYDNNGKEIDFLAEKDNKKYYIQVAYSVVDRKAHDREFSAFKNLSQIDTKIIITNDDIDYSTSNIRHIKLKDFLIKGIE